MKQSRFFAILFGAAMVLLVSCGGNEEKKTSESSTTSDTTAAATTTETTMAANTIVTTPQNMLVVRHKVANYEKWKMSYDSHDSMRLADGVHNYVIARGVDDSNMLLVATKVDDLAKAKAFAKDPNLKKAMQKGGVTGTPVIRFVTMVYQDTSALDSKMRSASMFKVKDWDAWKHSFDSTRALNTDNGVKIRAYGYDPDDNHNVTVVVAIMDTAKAHAFWTSDLLKQRRAAGGVIGTPERFVYNVVEKY